MEASCGIVAVVEQSGSRIKLQLHVLGGTASVGDERMQAHYHLLHPAPKRVAVPWRAPASRRAAPCPLERIRHQLSEVVTAAGTHFAEANLGVVGQSERSRGGRCPEFLRHSGRQFDVIVGDLVVPWRRGESAYFRGTLRGRTMHLRGGLFTGYRCFSSPRKSFASSRGPFLMSFHALHCGAVILRLTNPRSALGHADEKP
jgi:hypothetical protein